MIETVAAVCIGIIAAVFSLTLLASYGRESELEQKFNQLNDRVSLLEQEDDLK